MLIGVWPLDGQVVSGLEKVTFSSTGGWSEWEEPTLPKALSLKAGQHTLRMTNLSGEGGLNLDWIKLVK